MFLLSLSSLYARSAVAPSAAFLLMSRRRQRLFTPVPSLFGFLGRPLYEAIDVGPRLTTILLAFNVSIRPYKKEDKVHSL